MRQYPLFIFAALILSPVQATEQVGPVHPIIEPDMLLEIHRTLREKEQSGELERLKQEAIKRSSHSVENPKPVEGVSRVVKGRVFYWDPTIRVPQTIYSPSGEVIAEAGKTVNPLDYVNLSRHLLFIDGDDPEQVRKARVLLDHYKGMVKPILVGGKPFDLMRQWQSRVYFDQGGFLVKKLGIAHVPALVSQDGTRLRIDELEMP